MLGLPAGTGGIAVACARHLRPRPVGRLPALLARPDDDRPEGQEASQVQYRYAAQDAQKFTKHGIDLTVYGQENPSATVVHVHVERGHFQEFYNVRSAYIYYIVSGRGVFHLNSEAIAVGATDLIVVPPNTRVYYFGTMEMVLTVAPAFVEQDERHVRFVEDSECRID
ncbi:cupin domain-containing protein [Micromonospora sp. NPDC005298]|uniref:cupin domain-containing protein n=1 Tax=Micromonospora sp. NPDC005298 TaxID=3156873 RepID=UPI0033A3A4F1